MSTKPGEDQDIKKQVRTSKILLASPEELLLLP